MVSDALERLITLLGREVELVEELVHRVTVVSLVMVAHEDRFLNRASEDVEAAISRLRTHGVERDVAVGEVRDALGVVDDEATLRQLAVAAPREPRAVLLALRNRLDELVTELAEVSDKATAVAGTGLDRVRIGLEELAMGAPGPRYRADGATAAREVPPTWFDGRA